MAQAAVKKAKAAGENERAAYDKAYQDFLEKAGKARAAGLPFDMDGLDGDSKGETKTKSTTVTQQSNNEERDGRIMRALPSLVELKEIGIVKGDQKKAVGIETGTEIVIGKGNGATLMQHNYNNNTTYMISNLS